MPEYEKISINLDRELYDQIELIVRKSSRLKRNDVVNDLIEKGLQAEKELAEYKRLNELGILRILFVLREIAKTREDDFLQEIDKKFLETLPELKALVLGQGIDYVG